MKKSFLLCSFILASALSVACSDCNVPDNLPPYDDNTPADDDTTVDKDDPLYKGCEYLVGEKLDEIFYDQPSYPREKIEKLRESVIPYCVNYYSNIPICTNENLATVNCWGSKDYSDWRTQKDACLANCSGEDGIYDCLNGDDEDYNTCIETPEMVACLDLAEISYKCNDYYRTEKNYDNTTYNIQEAIGAVISKWNKNSIRPLTEEEQSVVEAVCVLETENRVDDEYLRMMTEAQFQELKTIVNNACIKYYSEMPACIKEWSENAKCALDNSTDGDSESNVCDSKYEAYSNCHDLNYIEIEQYVDETTNHPGNVLEVTIYMYYHNK